MDERLVRTPPADEIVFRHLIDRYAAEQPDEVFAAYLSDEPDWTWGGMRELVRETAAALAGAGVQQGDHVLCWLDNGPTFIRYWLATNYLGAVFVPINIAYKGQLLQHVVELSQARLMIAHASLAKRLADVSPGRLEKLVAVGDATGLALPGIEVVTEDGLREGSLGGGPELARPIEPWDPQVILFTSGTTGPSKAVLCSNMHMWTMGQVSFPYADQTDRGLVYTPLFHVTALASVIWALGHGTSIGVIERFSTQTFWKDVLAVGGTFMVMMGSVSSFLVALPRTPEEKRTTMRHTVLAPMTPEGIALCERVGMNYHSVFNMTETANPIRTERNPSIPYTCGRVRDGVEVRIVDEHDNELPHGEVGELVVRADAPWTMATEYFGNPEATATAWRNGWFHTGDALRRDEDGNFFYVDRLKDAIRRRGENISSYEVEIEVLTHPEVDEVGAIAVPSEHGEDEVMIVVVRAEDSTLEPAELLEYLVGRMPHYMVPRYIRLVDSLPKTPTLKIQKAVLRQAGHADAWDREAAGIRVKREAIA